MKKMGLDWLVLVLVAGLPAYLVRFDIAGIPTTLWEMGLYISVLMFLATRCWDWRSTRRDPLLPFLGVILVASVLSFLAVDDLRLAFGQWKALIIDAILFYCLLRQVLPRAARWIEGAAVVGGSGVAIHALVTWWTQLSVMDGRAVGIYAADAGASPNYVALFLAPLAALTGGMIVRDLGKGGWPRLSLVTGGLAVMVLALIASGSRAGLVATGLSLGWLGVTWLGQRFGRFRRSFWIAFGLIITLGLSVFWPQLVPNRTIDEAEGGRIVTSNNIRAEIWLVTTLELLPEMPVTGLGLGQFQRVFTDLTVGRPNYQEYIAPWALHPHNILLTHWVSLGFLGLVGWLGFYRRLWQLIRPYFTIVLPAASGLGVWFLQGLVDTPYYKNDLAALFMILAALAISRPRPSSRVTRPS